MFEVTCEQIRNGVGRTSAVTSPFEVDVRHTTFGQFKTAVACEAIGQIDPAVGESFGCAGTFEVFIEKQRVRIAAAHIADARHLEWRQVVVVAEGVHKKEIDPHI